MPLIVKVSPLTKIPIQPVRTFVLKFYQMQENPPQKSPNSFYGYGHYGCLSKAEWKTSQLV